MAKPNPSFAPDETKSVEHNAETLANYIAILRGMGRDIEAKMIRPWLKAMYDKGENDQRERYDSMGDMD